MSKDDWLRVSKANPCPICRKPDNCCVSISGEAVFCGRVTGTIGKVNQGGQHLHVLNDSSALPLHRRPRQTVTPSNTNSTNIKTPKKGRQKTSEEINRIMNSLPRPSVALDALALDLGLTGRSFGRHDIRVESADVSRPYCWCFVERNGQGDPVGITQRFQVPRLINGKPVKKQQVKNTRRGLFYSVQNFGGVGKRVFLPEGLTDVLALNDLDIPAIGRPSNRMGATELATMIEYYPSHQFVLIGENDQKACGAWPGLDGCRAVAKQIYEICGEILPYVMPSSQFKDIREWVQ